MSGICSGRVRSRRSQGSEAKCRAFFEVLNLVPAIALDTQSKANVCGRSLVEIAGSSPAGGMDVCLLCISRVVHVEFSATGRSFVQVSPTRCLCVIECYQAQQQPSAPALSR
jgi:hypothetical protein